MPVCDYGDDDKDYANVPLATLAALAAPKTHHSTTITKTLSFRIYQAHQNVLISHFRFNFQHTGVVQSASSAGGCTDVFSVFRQRKPLVTVLTRPTPSLTTN